MGWLRMTDPIVLLTLMAAHPELSKRKLAERMCVSRRTVSRVADRVARLEQEKGTRFYDLDITSLSSITEQRRRGASKMQPDIAAVELALREGGTIKAQWREYRSSLGHRGLGYAQFARVCRQHGLNVRTPTSRVGLTLSDSRVHRRRRSPRPRSYAE